MQADLSNDRDVTVKYCTYNASSKTVYLLDGKTEGDHFGRDSVLAYDHVKGELTLPKDLKKGHPGMYAVGATVTVLAAGAFVATAFATFPMAAFVQVFALEMLSVVGYGIANDQLACRQSIEYFTVGHTDFHKRLLETDDPTLNGIVWGIYATWIEGSAAGLLSAAVATATNVTSLPGLLPLLAMTNLIGTAAICYKAHQAAKLKEQTTQGQHDLRFVDKVLLPKDAKKYHPVLLCEVPRHRQAAYMATSDRNETGFRLMPKLYLAKLATILAIGAVTNVWMRGIVGGYAAISAVMHLRGCPLKNNPLLVKVSAALAILGLDL